MRNENAFLPARPLVGGGALMGEHVRADPEECLLSPPVIAQSAVTPIPLGPRAPPGLGARPLPRGLWRSPGRQRSLIFASPGGRPEREATGRTLSVFSVRRV